MKSIIELIHENGSISSNRLIDKLQIAKLNLVDWDDNTLLHHAAVSRNTNVVQFLTYEGADPNAQNKNGDTPLHLAVCTYDDTAVELLMQAGACSNIENNFGDTPLSLCDTENNKIIDLLLQNEGVAA